VTDTERWVNGVCGLIVATGTVRLYKDMYKDMRERLPCGVACRLIENGLRHTHYAGGPDDPYLPPRVFGDRARAIAALKRLERWAEWFVTEAELRARDGL
jgi:hypothetical protein